MTIKKELNGTTLKLTLIGRLDTTTAPGLEEVINSEAQDIKSLIFDIKELDYVSSAGLRVFLMAQKKMNRQGEMCLVNVKDEINEIFEITGFSDILTIK